MEIPIEVFSNVLTALIGAGGGWLAARVTARSGTEQRLTEATDKRLKLLIDGYERRTQSLISQVEALEKRISGITRQYEQRIEGLIHQIDGYQQRMSSMVDNLDQHGDEK